jgi:hypothetical protein
MRGVEVGDLGGIHAGAAADREVAVEAALLCEPDGVAERDVCRLDPRLGVKDGVDGFAPEGIERHDDRRQGRQPPVGHHHHATRTQFLHVVADFACRAKAILDTGGDHGEHRLQPRPFRARAPPVVFHALPPLRQDVLDA